MIMICRFFLISVIFVLFRGEPHIDFCKQDDSPTPCHLHHSQNFEKIDSFLKSVLNICILGDLIVGWGGWVKKWAGILHQIFRFNGVVNIWGRIHQNKSWYSLGPSQISKVDFFAEIIFGCKPLTFP